MKQIKSQSLSLRKLQSITSYPTKVERKQNTNTNTTNTNSTATSINISNRQEIDEKRQVKPKVKEFPKLTWADFQAEPDHESGFHAHTYWKISYSFSVVIRGNKANISLNARCIFESNRSWVKSEHKTQELLEHEQGHYYIGCLCALNFKRRVRNASFTKASYRLEINKIFRETLQEYLAMEKRYDEETEHFLDQEIQKKWDKKIITQINELRPYWWM